MKAVGVGKYCCTMPAAQHHLPYLDLVDDFSDTDGRLPAEDTVDGLHLNQRGYEKWRDEIRPYVKS